MKMRVLWTAVAAVIAVVIAGQAEAQKRPGSVQFEACMYLRTNPTPPCLVAGDYVLLRTQPGAATTNWPGVWVTVAGRPAGYHRLCRMKALRVDTITAHYPCVPFR